MKKTLLAFAVIAALLSPLQADENIVGTTLSKLTLHRLDGKAFKEAKLEKSPEYFILYYSASW